MLFCTLYYKIVENVVVNKMGGFRTNMKKKVVAIIMIMMMCLMLSAVAYRVAASNAQADLSSDSTVNLVKLKDKELKTLEDYRESYGNDTYGFVAYLLNIIRIYSIPFGFVGIAISGIYRYVIGIRKLDVRDKGFGAMIGIITVMVICQVLPLVFAIVVKGWRG